MAGAKNYLVLPLIDEDHRLPTHAPDDFLEGLVTRLCTYEEANQNAEHLARAYPHCVFIVFRAETQYEMHVKMTELDNM